MRISGSKIALSLLSVCSACALYASQPNIIIYMVDDLGWNHLSAQGVAMGSAKSIYHTPHLERLAEHGLSFTHAYAQPNCAPTRAAMLSGQYPARVNNDVYVVGHLNRFGRGGITKEAAQFKGPTQSEDVEVAAVTVAEAMKKNGYTTAHLGKYHVGGREGGERTLPENSGFDINVGGFKQGHQPSCFAQKKQGQWTFKNLGRGDFDEFSKPYTESYLKRRGLPLSLEGTPKHVSDALGDALEVTLEDLSKGDAPFYLQFYSYAVHGPVRARPDLKKLAAKRVTNGDNKLIEYAGFVSSMDENLGRMLELLEDPNRDGDSSDSIADNTLILFTSDNGGTHADNLPLRGEKGMFTEGGIRVPLIAYWPGKIPPNTVTDFNIHAVDYYPTCVELAGSKWQPSEAEHPLDGFSFADVLFSPRVERIREPIFFIFPGYMDVRAEPCAVIIDEIQGNRYKLYYYYESNSWELYCLSQDESEKYNIFSNQPEIASTLSKKIRAWLEQEHKTWRPKYPISKKTGQSVGPPPVLK